MGNFGGSQVMGATPGRRTHVFFDISNSYIAEPTFDYGRPANAMFKDGGAGFNQLAYDSGWGIRAFHESLDTVVERTEAQSYWLSVSGGSASVAPFFRERYLFRAPLSSEMPTGTTGSSNLATQGFVGYEKSVPAGTDFNTNNLSGDQAAFPPPTTGADNPYGLNDTIPLDRVFVSFANDNPETPVLFYISTYGSILTTNGLIARCYFNGPAGKDKNGTGNGQYCLTVFLSRPSVLFENSANGWIKRAVIPTHLKMGLAGIIWLRVYKSKECVGPTDGSGGYLKFDFCEFPADNYNQEGITNTNVLIGPASKDVSSHHNKKYHYRVPGDGTTPTTNTKVRVDIRRTLMGTFAVAWFRYPSNEVSADDTFFVVPFRPGDYGDNFPFTLTWDDCVPVGCSATLRLMRADNNTELTVLSSASHKKVYRVPPGVTKFYVRIVLQSNGSRTPIFRGWNLHRDGVILSGAATPWEIGDEDHPKSYSVNINIRGAERIMDQNTATVLIADPLNSLDELRTRASLHIRIESEYDSTDTSKRVSLFRGIAESSFRYLKRSGTDTFPVQSWSLYDVKCNSLFQVLDESFVGTPVLSLIDHETGLPFEVGKFIRKTISNCGWAYNTEFDFPDTGIHFSSVSELDFSQTIDMLEKSGSVVKSLARDYLAHFLIYDDDVNKWRLIPVPSSPYTKVAEFTTKSPSDLHAERIGGSPPILLTHYLPAYSGLGTDGVPVFPIEGGSMQSNVIAPEANWLIVATIGLFNSDVPQLCVTEPLINHNSFGPTATPTDNPDYIGRKKAIYVIDPALGSAGDESQIKAALAALARRIADLTFYARKILTFRAPIVFIEHESNPAKKRMLRYYDPVYVDGTEWLVRNVNPDYEKDGVQYAMYELEAPRV